MPGREPQLTLRRPRGARRVQGSPAHARPPQDRRGLPRTPRSRGEGESRRESGGGRGRRRSPKQRARRAPRSAQGRRGRARSLARTLRGRGPHRPATRASGARAAHPGRRIPAPLTPGLSIPRLGGFSARGAGPRPPPAPHAPERGLSQGSSGAPTARLAGAAPGRSKQAGSRAGRLGGRSARPSPPGLAAPPGPTAARGPTPGRSGRRALRQHLNFLTFAVNFPQTNETKTNTFSLGSGYSRSQHKGGGRAAGEGGVGQGGPGSWPGPPTPLKMGRLAGGRPAKGKVPLDLTPAASFPRPHPKS